MQPKNIKPGTLRGSHPQSQMTLDQVVTFLSQDKLEMFYLLFHKTYYQQTW